MSYMFKALGECHVITCPIYSIVLMIYMAAV
jgi:hypothetical protein